MDISMIEEMDRLIDQACQDPTTPEGRVALAQAAELWRSFSAGMRRGLTMAQNLPEPSRTSLQELILPLLHGEPMKNVYSAARRRFRRVGPHQRATALELPAAHERARALVKCSAVPRTSSSRACGPHTAPASW